MSHRFYVAALAGAAISASLSGAASALTAIPPAVMLAAGAGMALLALNQTRRSPSDVVCMLIGSACGLTLPRLPPAVTGPVVTATSLRGSGDLFEVLERIDEQGGSALGRQVTVSGIWRAKTPQREAAVWRRVMSCCAADALAVGFDVSADRRFAPSTGDWVVVRGRLRATLRDGEMRYRIDATSIASAARPPGL